MTVPADVQIPEGDLIRSRVVADAGVTLSAALDDELTGYAVVEPQDALLLGDGGRAVLTFEDGVPVLAYDPATDRGGSDALADFAAAGPYRVEVYELPASALDAAHGTDELRVPPTEPADRLADDPSLAERTREAAPADRLDAGEGQSAVEEFLADADRIEAIREEAREEAAARAEEWGLSDQLE
ncbi:hypothetical protein [Halopelagius longus]|uniref:DUF8054 domain-containing protein n=1 Tax=Halopelagius longus TaxID=1236180 RepID=A0A1H1DI08_9EURY|nr:hypothetical protein [Halopelagius longus]RDI71341.1 hypothetical protein DWB78_06135 [Halopelagius longus]SDQ76113.1 hypothetical protein SAMN05216278_2425 [Halopelagius longus]